MAFDPVDFIARLAALVPKSRVNLTRYHGVLAPNHRWRGLVTPAKRGKGALRPADSDVVSSIQRHAAMTWAQRLKRVFNIGFVDLFIRERCDDLRHFLYRRFCMDEPYGTSCGTKTCEF